MKKYTVKQGGHYSDSKFEKFLSIFSCFGKKQVDFQVQFDASCFNNEAVTAVSKVGGITWGLGDDHHNSCRLGFDTSGTVYTYKYQLGVGPTYERLTNVQPGVIYRVTCSNKGIIFRAPFESIEHTFVTPIPTSFFAFKCFFYIGGSVYTAPRDQFINMEWL